VCALSTSFLTVVALCTHRKAVVLQTSAPEQMVKDATTMEKWGPTATQMREITQLTYSE
jgi:hypothetical protein